MTCRRQIHSTMGPFETISFEGIDQHAGTDKHRAIIRTYMRLHSLSIVRPSAQCKFLHPTARLNIRI